MLLFAEEIVLLMIDDDGVFLPIRESTMEYVITGAALLDLAFANRIDTDPEQLVVIDRTPTGQPLLDRIFAHIAASEEVRDVRYWIETLANEEAAHLRAQILTNLVNHGILQSRDERFLWVFRERRYPVIDGRAEREVKLRITGVLLSAETPHPRDAAMIGLADACNILTDIFSDREMERVRSRVTQLRRMDLIGHEVGKAVTEIERSIMTAIAMAPH